MIGKKIRGLSLALAVFTAAACSDGTLEDRYDRYYNIFGLNYTPPPAGKAGIIGRVLLEEGSPAGWARVEIRPLTKASPQAPSSAITNAKGGFYLGGIDPGPYKVFITTAASQGMSFEIDIHENEVIENAEIRLSRMIRLSGMATLKGEPAHAGILVFSPGSPFSALTDHEGNFYFEVPAGNYSMRAEKDNFIPWESGGAVAALVDAQVNIELLPNPWPDGKIGVDSGDGFIVRGKAVNLKMQAVAGVRYFRLSNFRGAFDFRWIGKFQEWQPVTAGLTVTHSEDGFRSFDVMFMDSYGKQSKPLSVRYYTTSLAEDWVILHGLIKAPITITPGMKVAFINYDGHSGSSSDVPAMSDEQEDPADSSDQTDSQPNPTGSDSILANGASSDSVGSSPGTVDSVDFGQTVFYGTVTIGENTQIAGGAVFLGDLLVRGTANKPVVWKPETPEGNRWVSATGPQAKIAGLISDGMNFDFSPEKVTNVELTSIHLKHGRLSFNSGQKINTNSSAVNSFTLSRSVITDSEIVHYCDQYIDAVKPVPVGQQGADQVNIPRTRSGSMKSIFELNTSNFSSAGVFFNCSNHQGIEAIYNINHNNFLDLAADRFYFATNMMPDEKKLPADTEINGTGILANHFKIPAKQYAGFAEHGWRFGVNVELPWALPW